ncbi:FxsA family protein [Pseudonocardia benzenivorans]
MPYVLLYLVVEIVALVALGSWIGVGATLLVLLAGSIIGIALARREGLRAAQAFSQAVRDRRVAHAELTDGMLVAAAGVLIFVPGLVTDVAGLLLLVPPVRKLVRNRLVRAAERANPDLQRARIYGEGPVVDGDVVGRDGNPAGARVPRIAASSGRSPAARSSTARSSARWSARWSRGPSSTALPATRPTVSTTGETARPGRSAGRADPARAGADAASAPAGPSRRGRREPEEGQRSCTNASGTGASF